MNQTQIIAMLALLVFGGVYAAVVRHLRKRNRDHGQTAWLVVIGDGVVVVAYGLIAGLEQALILAGLFAAAGAPMVIEYVDAHTDALRRSAIASRLRGDRDGV